MWEWLESLPGGGGSPPFFSRKPKEETTTGSPPLKNFLPQRIEELLTLVNTSTAPLAPFRLMVSHHPRGENAQILTTGRRRHQKLSQMILYEPGEPSGT